MYKILDMFSKIQNKIITHKLTARFQITATAKHSQGFIHIRAIEKCLSVKGLQL